MSCNISCLYDTNMLFYKPVCIMKCEHYVHKYLRSDTPTTHPSPSRKPMKNKFHDLFTFITIWWRALRHDTLTSCTCSVTCNSHHDDVFIVKYDDGGIRLAVCDCLSPLQSPFFQRRRHRYRDETIVVKMHKRVFWENLIERDFHGSIN